MQSDSRVSGSFRDPSGYVIVEQDRVFRAVDHQFAALFREIESTPAWKSLLADRLVVSTKLVTDAKVLSDLKARNPGFDTFLEHEPLSHISYPYEWSVSMLADAGELTLEIQKRLLGAGFSLKDATAYNVQFVNSRPIFIDISSIERPKRLDLWFALGQFNRMFLYPLLLTQRGWDLRSYFLSNLDGRGVDKIGECFPGLARWSAGLLLDVTLPLLLERKAAQNQSFSWEKQDQKETRPDSQLLNLQRLRKKIRGLAAAYKTKGVWASYTQTCSYDTEAEAAKKSLVSSFLQEQRVSSVMDIGCNTGDYSFLAAEAGADVVAVDADHDAVENLYLRLRQSGKPIMPLVINLANPSPAIGFMNRERPAFFDRYQADCVLALALIHHLLVSANLSAAAIAELFARLTSKYLVVEFVPPKDPMFQKLVQFRVNLFADLTLESFLQSMAPQFELIRQEPVAHSPRTLLFMRRK